MYEAFYGLTERPFNSVPDPDYIYWTENHALAFAMLNHGLVGRAPITVVTGAIGAGKTTLLRQLLRDAPEALDIGLVSNMQAARGQLLQWAMMALGQQSGDEPYVALFQRFQDYLISRYAEGRSVVLIFDEAQNLAVEQLEELRMLSNINADKDQLLQLMLVGQPELRAILSRPELKQFSQRISSDFHLTAMEERDVAPYIDHRLSIAGAAWRIFPEGTCRLVHAATAGVPRLINILCDLCLIYGYAAEQKVIAESLLREFLESAHRRGIYQQFTPVLEAPALLRTAP